MDIVLFRRFLNILLVSMLGFMPAVLAMEVEDSTLKSQQSIDKFSVNKKMFGLPDDAPRKDYCLCLQKLATALWVEKEYVELIKKYVETIDANQQLNKDINALVKNDYDESGNNKFFKVRKLPQNSENDAFEDIENIEDIESLSPVQEYVVCPITPAGVATAMMYREYMQDFDEIPNSLQKTFNESLAKADVHDKSRSNYEVTSITKLLLYKLRCKILDKKIDETIVQINTFGINSRRFLSDYILNDYRNNNKYVCSLAPELEELIEPSFDVSEAVDLPKTLLAVALDLVKRQTPQRRAFQEDMYEAVFQELKQQVAAAINASASGKKIQASKTFKVYLNNLMLKDAENLPATLKEKSVAKESTALASLSDQASIKEHESEKKTKLLKKLLKKEKSKNKKKQKKPQQKKHVKAASSNAFEKNEEEPVEEECTDVNVSSGKEEVDVEANIEEKIEAAQTATKKKKTKKSSASLEEEKEEVSPKTSSRSLLDWATVIEDKANGIRLYAYNNDSTKRPLVEIEKFTENVKEWFNSPDMALTHQGYRDKKNPKYVSSDEGCKQVLRRHCFSQKIDKLIKTNGIQTEVPSRKHAEPDICISIPGHVEDIKTGEQRFCLFVWLIDRQTQVCFHRNIEYRLNLIDEYLATGSFAVTVPDDVAQMMPESMYH